MDEGVHTMPAATQARTERRNRGYLQKQTMTASKKPPEDKSSPLNRGVSTTISSAKLLRACHKEKIPCRKILPDSGERLRRWSPFLPDYPPRLRWRRNWKLTSPTGRSRPRPAPSPQTAAWLSVGLLPALWKVTGPSAGQQMTALNN